MEPISEFQELLTSGSNTDNIKENIVNVVRCEHVVPSENVLGVCLSKGPTNVSLNFSYENRMSNELVTLCTTLYRNLIIRFYYPSKYQSVLELVVSSNYFMSTT